MDLSALQMGANRRSIDGIDAFSLTLSRMGSDTHGVTRKRSAERMTIYFTGFDTIPPIVLSRIQWC